MHISAHQLQPCGELMEECRKYAVLHNLQMIDNSKWLEWSSHYINFIYNTISNWTTFLCEFGKPYFSLLHI